jgi:hypothetical protein
MITRSEALARLRQRRSNTEAAAAELKLNASDACRCTR